MSAPVALKCPNCAAQIKTGDCDPAKGIATCGYCRSMITLPGYRPTQEKKRLTMPLPPGMSIDESAGGTIITRRWFSVAILFLIFFCVAWDAFLIFWYGIAFTTHAPWIMTVFPLVHVAVGVGLTYFTLAGIFNRTWIKAVDGVVSVLHGPLPWAGNQVIPCSEIEQFFCKEKVSHGKNGPSVRYEVWFARHDGTSRKLLGGTLTDEQAIYVEQRLEKALGITDRTVAGELMR